MEGLPRKARSLYLVDGTAQLFRAYFAIRGLTSPEGVPTNAVFGFTAMLRKLIREAAPEYLAVAWDLPGPTVRHEKYAAYKAHRPATPEDLDVQVPDAKEVCRAFRVPVLEREGYEADDLIATFTRRARERGFEVVIVTADKDLLQLVGDGVVHFNPGKDLRLDASGVREQFGVPPERVIDVLGLMGDAVDNIPGVPSVGEKTAKEIVATYGSLECVLERAARYVAAFAARDAALVELEDGERIPDLPAVAGALRSLAEVEVDPGLRERFLDAAAELAGLDAADSVARRAARKRLKELETKTSRRAWTAIHEHRDVALLSRDLATVHGDLDVPFDEDDLRLAPPDRGRAAALFARLGFRTLAAEFAAHEDPAIGPAGDGPTYSGYDVVLDERALHEVLRACRSAGRFAVDTETDGTNPLRANLVGIALGWAAGRAAYVPVGHRYPGAPAQLPLDVVRAHLGPVLGDPRLRKVGQNLKYDLHVLRRHELPVEGWDLDTMVAAFLLDSDRASFDMDALSAHYLRHTPIPYSAVAGKGAAQKSLAEVDVAKVAEYSAEDADVTWRLAECLEPQLRDAGLLELYHRIDGPILPLLADMEAAGIRVDPDRLRDMSAEMEAGLREARTEVCTLAGIEFNLDSPKQLREVLFGRLGLTPVRKTAKAKEYSTDAQTLEELASDHPIASRILEYRELAKLKSTYVDALPLLVHPETGRIHTSYHPTGAATGRLSSSDPNLQNIPARSPMGLRIREAFVPGDGAVFLAADYSQVELRVLAHLSGDPGLLEAFRDHEDIHRVTAAAVAGIDPALVSPEMRRRAKAVNFGILYGMSDMRLAREHGMTLHDARAFKQAYFERFAAVKAYIDRVHEQATRDGQVRTLFGRVRRFPQLRDRIARPVREQALRAALNATIQGTAADLMKLAMIGVDRGLHDGGFRSRILLQVHDELLLEVPEQEAQGAESVVRRAMEDVYPLAVPLTVDVKTGANWREVT